MIDWERAEPEGHDESVVGRDAAGIPHYASPEIASAPCADRMPIVAVHL